MRVGKVGLFHLECVLGRQNCSTWNACWKGRIIPLGRCFGKVGLFHLNTCWEDRIVPPGMRVGKVGLFHLEYVLGR